MPECLKLGDSSPAKSSGCHILISVQVCRRVLKFGRIALHVFGMLKDALAEITKCLSWNHEDRYSCDTIDMRELLLSRAMNAPIQVINDAVSYYNHQFGADSV